jgi:hypothetical protein
MEHYSMGAAAAKTRQDPSIVEIPNLIEVQKRSYETFLQKDGRRPA